MKKIIILFVFLSSQLALAGGVIECPINNGNTVKIDLREQFEDLDPLGYLSFIDPQGKNLPGIEKVHCSGQFLLGYIGYMSCVGLLDRKNLIRVNISYNAQNDVFSASVFFERDENQLISIAEDVRCTTTSETL